MAADVASDPDTPNPCCAKLKKKFLKLEESRKALRQAVQILEQQINKLESENADLKKVYQAQENAELQKKANEEESSIILKLEKEINELKAEITAHQQQEIKDHSKMLDACITERDAEIKMLKERLVKEKTKGDTEKKKAEVERKKAAEERKFLEMEKRKAEDERNLAESERKKAEEVRLSLERLKNEVNEARAKLTAERTKSRGVEKLIEEEKQKNIMEKKCADLARAKAEELSKALEVQQREARDEKVHVEHMKQMLEDEKQKKEDLQKKLVEIEREAASVCPGCQDKKLKGNTSAKAATIKSLKVQLKFEKKRLKYAKKMAKLEKAEKMFISQQFHLLKQDFIQISCHLKMLGDQLSHRTEGTHSLAKIEGSSDLLRFDLKNITSGLRCSENGFQLGKCSKDSFHIPSSTRECSCFDASGGQYTRQILGIKSKVESLTRGSFRNKQQSSTVCSTSTTCSDRALMGSQGIDAAFPAASSKLAEGFLNQRLMIPNLPCVDSEDMRSKKVEAEKRERSYIQNNFDDAHRSASVYDGNKVADKVTYGGRKKRKIHYPPASVTSFCDKDKQFHLETAEKPLTGKNMMRTKGGLPTAICHQNSGISKFTNDWRGPLTEIHDDMCRRYHKSFRCAEEKQGTLSFQPPSQGRKDKLENDCSALPCFPCNSASIAQNINENYPSSRKEETCAVGDGQADLVCFENVIREDIMKLLELDNEDDERRYREAIERPISPTLPGIKFSKDRLKGEDHSHYLVAELFRKSGSGEDIFEPLPYFDVIDLEINSNKLEFITSLPLVPKDNKGSINASEESKLNGVLTVQRDLNKHVVLDNDRHNFQNRNNMSSNLGKVSDAKELDVSTDTVDFEPSIRKSQENLQAKPLVHHLIDPYAVPGLSITNNTLTRENDQPLASDAGLSDNQVIGKPKEHDNTKRKSLEVGDDFLGAGKDSQTGSHQISAPSPIVGSESFVHLSDSQELQNPCGGNVGLEGTTGYCVVFSDTTDEDSISRIVQSRNTLASENFGRSQVDSSIIEVLHILAVKAELQREEKVCVFFSLLLSSISGSLFANCGSIIVGDILQFTKSFAKEINKGDEIHEHVMQAYSLVYVISDASACWLFLEICPLDILLNLIEDFLIRRRIMMCNAMESEQSWSSILPGKLRHLTGQNMFVSEIAAKTDQLIAASILSASVCAVLDQIGFLVEVSYKILRLCKYDTTCNLLMLHIFACASGENFFTLEKYTFLVSAITSVVSLLENGDQSLLSFHSASDVNISFSPCKHCPFSKDAVCAEKVASFLMGILQHFALTGSSSGTYSFLSSLYPTPECVSQAEESTCCSREPGCLGSECEALCVLFKYRDHAADLSDYIPKGVLCFFTDVVSVVELFGCYMSWKWTSDNILPHLLRILESCPPHEFSAATVVLIGQLGRFGIDFGGYQQTEVSELRCSLSSLLDTYIKGKSSLPNQLAVVGALVNLLPVSFGEIVGGSHEHSVDSNQSHQIKHVKEWFSHLNKKMQFLALNFFGQC